MLVFTFSAFTSFDNCGNCNRLIPNLTAENVHIVADLSGLTGAGVHTVPVTIRIEGYENIGIKGSYQMVVDLSVTPDEPGQP